MMDTHSSFKKTDFGNTHTVSKNRTDTERGSTPLKQQDNTQS